MKTKISKTTKKIRRFCNKYEKIKTRLLLEKDPIDELDIICLEMIRDSITGICDRYRQRRK